MAYYYCPLRKKYFGTLQNCESSAGPGPEWAWHWLLEGHTPPEPKYVQTVGVKSAKNTTQS